MRDPRVVEALVGAAALDTRADFGVEENLTAVAAALKALKVPATVSKEEEHSTYKVTYQDPTQAERHIDVELAATPEFRRLRTIAKQIAKYNTPPFFVYREGGAKEEVLQWRDLLEKVKAEGMRDISIKRYKGLGEMNDTQLWETTMNAETRTLLKVSLEDLVLADQIFTTLMGEDVESRRKFIEENALDVRNLDV